MPRKLPLKVFLQTFKLSPRAAVSLIIVDRAGKVLLARRAIPPREGVWHLPGAFILRGEKISACIERIVKDELGLKIKGTSGDIVGIFEDLDKDPRGHVIDLVYKFTITREPRPTAVTKEWKFFTKLPRGIGFRHDGILRKAGFK